MSKTIQKIPKRGEIWLVDYNYKPKKGKEKELEIASRIKKVRPSLVVSNNIQNELDEQIIMASLTSDEIKEVADYEVFIKNTKETGLDKPSKVLLQRVRAVEKELRLIEYLGEVDKEIMKEVEKALKTVLDLED